MKRDERTTIQLSRELKEFLAAQAVKKGESYEEIIKRLLGKLWGARFGDQLPVK